MKRIYFTILASVFLFGTLTHAVAFDDTLARMLSERLSLELIGSLVPELRSVLDGRLDEVAERLAAASPGDGRKGSRAPQEGAACIPIDDLDRIIAHLARENRKI